ncbi:MAG TPA: glucuronate isomerase, partial [Humibacillus sp.]|nr:glucuronate isomerase [Humibacillus sp.]
MTTVAPAKPLALDPDRLLPVEPGTRAIARRLHAAVADLPIISPHGHVPPAWLAEDTAFSDPTSLLIAPDHYVFRLLHAQGVSLADLGVGGRPLTADGSRRAWRLLAEHWPSFRGTPSRFWMDCVLADVFGVTERLS